jgi:hypothetical protein
MHCKLQWLKKILQIPFIPLIGGSSPLWQHTDAIEYPLNALQ